MLQMAFCDLSHTFHKQVTNVSQHVVAILLWGILTSPLSGLMRAGTGTGDMVAMLTPSLPSSLPTANRRETSSIPQWWVRASLVVILVLDRARATRAKRRGTGRREGVGPWREGTGPTPG